MKNFNKIIALALALCMIVAVLCACGESEKKPPEAEIKDYSVEVAFDPASETKKQPVAVKAYVDGDTTHFHVPESVAQGGVLKARYLAINTPESTGKIEEYGKKASEFTRAKLSAATEILIESDDGNWNLDSTGGRYLVWVWYKTASDTVYRNLNIEILQNGLAIASSSANNRYGTTCMAALTQAKTEKLNIYSGTKDPDFYYGDAVELTLKELRLNIDDYSNKKVAFEGVITKNNNNSVYIEDYDAETDLYFGIAVYYGYGLNGDGLEILSVGNRSRIVGTVQYYEAGGSYQISGLTYKQMRPDDPENIRKISEGNEAAYLKISAERLTKETVMPEPESSKTYRFAELALGTTVSMDNLHVKSVYTTMNEESSSFGAMTLNCECDGISVSVRTSVLYDENRNIITADAYENKTVSVRGIVGIYNGEYQINVFTVGDITVIG